VEQFVRDARITQIYEGTNGVQAMDLAGRKLPMENGDLAFRFFKIVQEDLEATVLEPDADPVARATIVALDRLKRTTALVLERRDDPDFAGSAATDYLRLFALVAFGWMWSKMAANADAAGDPLKQRKLATARFFADRMLPQAAGLEAAIFGGSASIMGMDAQLF
jgi:alkylation response protein AidB-like acyl-CoA dehydrogenase